MQHAHWEGQKSGSGEHVLPRVRSILQAYLLPIGSSLRLVGSREKVGITPLYAQLVT